MNFDIDIALITVWFNDDDDNIYSKQYIFFDDEDLNIVGDAIGITLHTSCGDFDIEPDFC